MNGSFGVRGYMLRQDFSADFQIEIDEKVDAYRVAHDTAYQHRLAERMSLNAPSERAIPPSCETTVGRIEDALTDFENQFNNFFWSQGFLAAMTAIGSVTPWPETPAWLQAMERAALEQAETLWEKLPDKESQRGKRYFQLRREDIVSGAGYRYLHGYEFAFCALESTGYPMNPARLKEIYVRLGLTPSGGDEYITEEDGR